MAPARPDLTIIMVSYNTRDLTLAAIRTCLETTLETSYRLVVLDNASHDGSADAIEEAFGADPRVELIRSSENLGFAKANNDVAEQCDTRFLLLLNPDTECHPEAVDNLMAFAAATPQAKIWGGRTVFPDGSLNPSSCWMRITPWSLLCWAVGLTAAFPRTSLFNPEALGSWQRDSVRPVDIVSGCFFLVERDLWNALGGFDLSYFMYGEEADLCLRAEKAGAAPMVTSEATIMHIVGASAKGRPARRQMVLKARATLIRRHMTGWRRALSLGLLWGGVGGRMLSMSTAAALLRSASWKERAEGHQEIWGGRRDWLQGYAPTPSQ